LPRNDGTLTFVTSLLTDSTRLALSSLLGPRSRWFSYLQSLPRETVDIAMFWGVSDAVETRTCTCSARGGLDTDDTSSAADKFQRQVTPSQCPWCVWLHDNQNAREWLEATEIDREPAGLMVSPISLCWVQSAMSFSAHLQAFFFAPSFAFISLLFAWFLGILWVAEGDLPRPFQLLAPAVLHVSSPIPAHFHYFLMRVCGTR
jgi:hypothetical protein